MYEPNRTETVAVSAATEFPTKSFVALDLDDWEPALLLALADDAAAVEGAEVAGTTGLRVEETTGEVGATLTSGAPFSTSKYMPWRVSRQNLHQGQDLRNRNAIKRTATG